MRAREFIFEQDEVNNSGKPDPDPLVVAVLSHLRGELKAVKDKFGNVAKTMPLEKVLDKLRAIPGMSDLSREDLVDMVQDTASNPGIKKLVTNVTDKEVEFNVGDIDPHDTGDSENSGDSEETFSPTTPPGGPATGPDTVASMARHAMKSK